MYCRTDSVAQGRRIATPRSLVDRREAIPTRPRRVLHCADRLEVGRTEHPPSPLTNSGSPWLVAVLLLRWPPGCNDPPKAVTPPTWRTQFDERCIPLPILIGLVDEVRGCGGRGCRGAPSLADLGCSRPSRFDQGSEFALAQLALGSCADADIRRRRTHLRAPSRGTS